MFDGVHQLTACLPGTEDITTQAVPEETELRYKTTKTTKHPGTISIPPSHYISNTVGHVPTFIDFAHHAGDRAGHYTISMKPAGSLAVGDKVFINLELNHIDHLAVIALQAGGVKFRQIYEVTVADTIDDHVQLRNFSTYDNFTYCVSFEDDHRIPTGWPSHNAATQWTVAQNSLADPEFSTVVEAIVPWHLGFGVQLTIGDPPPPDSDFYALPFGAYPYNQFYGDTYLTVMGQYNWLVYWARFAGNRNNGVYDTNIANYYVGAAAGSPTGTEVRAYSTDIPAAELDSKFSPLNYDYTNAAPNKHARTKSLLFARAFKEYAAADPQGFFTPDDHARLDQWIMDLHRIYHRQRFWYVSGAEYVQDISPFPEPRQVRGTGHTNSVRPEGTDPLQAGQYLEDNATTQTVVTVPASSQYLAEVVRSGRIEMQHAIHATEGEVHGTVVYATRGCDESHRQELVARGLSIVIEGLMPRFSLVTASPDGRRHHHPSIKINLDFGGSFNLVQRTSITFDVTDIQQHMDYRFVYADTGQPLSDNHARTVGRVYLMLNFRGRPI